MKNFDYSKAKKVSIKIDGKEYTGSYVLKGRIVSVSTEYGIKSTQLGGLTPETLAQMLLTEIVSKKLK